MFLKGLGLPESTVKAKLRTRLNGEPLDWNTKHDEVGSGHYKLGMEVENEGVHTRSSEQNLFPRESEFVWTTWTVENGMHTTNFRCIIGKDGKLVEGTINIFALGAMPLDQGYVDELLEELKDDLPKWEEIE